jgi:UDP-N-acetylmuramate--alanine ligase
MGQKESTYFVGIGGIGMSALAQLYITQGKKVTGSDRDASKVTELLMSKGIEVFIGHNAKNLHPKTTLLIYSDAIPYENEERARARELGIEECSYFEALGEATKEGTSIVVSGTHGKTTTTAMLAKILIDTGKKPTVIAGSILSEYGSNFVKGKKDFFVIEGCEYKRHFLQLHPNILVVTNIELDHTDYFIDLEDMQDAFRENIELLPEDGKVIVNPDAPNIRPVLYGASQKTVAYQNTFVPKLKVPGVFNRENAQSAKTAVMTLFPKIDEGVVDKALKNFTGTWRRFEYKGVTKKGAVVYDDYAHHPTAVKATIEMAKEEFLDKKIVVAFHPHLYSRTKKFFDAFAEALLLADEPIALPVFAAREELDPTVSSEKLVEEICKKEKKALFVKSFSELEKILKKKGKDTLILTMGAGDVYKVADKIVSCVERQ